MLFKNTNLMTQSEQYLQYWGLAKLEKTPPQTEPDSEPKTKVKLIESQKVFR